MFLKRISFFRAESECPELPGSDPVSNWVGESLWFTKPCVSGNESDKLTVSGAAERCRESSRSVTSGRKIQANHICDNFSLQDLRLSKGKWIPTSDLNSEVIKIQWVQSKFKISTESKFQKLSEQMSGSSG